MSFDSKPSVGGVPRLSLAHFDHPQFRAAFISDLWHALASYGFVVICDHGIRPSTFARAYELTQQLFALPASDKQVYELGGGHRGYVSFGKETAKGCEFPDLKEFWHIGPEFEPGESCRVAPFPKNLWPDQQIPAFKAFFKGLHRELNQVALRLLHALAMAMQLPENYFNDLIYMGNSVQRLIHYPPLSALEQGSAVRAAAHADINLMTLLVGATESGLELLDKSGKWLAVENHENDLVVDTGDMMALLTNNELPATIHRVVNPTDKTKARYSIPYFVHPHKDALLSPLPQCVTEQNPAQFSAIRAGQFLEQRLKENGF